MILFGVISVDIRYEKCQCYHETLLLMLPVCHQTDMEKIYAVFIPRISKKEVANLFIKE